MNEPITKHKYQAFISYNHAADGRVAPAVQTALRRFGKAWYSPASIDVFRDETGLGLTPDLWGEIQQRLEQSQCFILLASPEAAQSQWVEKEIRHWLEHRSAGPLLIVLTGGKLSWSKEPNDFDWTQTNALPRTLQGVFPNEPLWADLSWAKTGAELSLRNPRFFGEIAKIVAGLRQKPLDEVFSEAAVQQKKARSLLWITVAVLAVLTVLAVAASTISFRSIADGRRLRAEALENQRLDDARLAAEKESRRQAVAAAALLAKDRELSARLALKALDIAPTREAEHALRQTLLGLISPLLLEGHSNVVNDAQFSVDSKRVMTTSDDGTVRVWNADTGTNLLVVRVVEDTKSGNYAAGSLSRDGTKVLTLVKPQTLAVGYWKSSSEPKLYDVATGNLIATIPDRFVVSAALSPDSLQIATAGFDTSAKIWDARTGKLRFDLRGHEHRVASVSFSSNGNWVMTTS